MNKVRVTKEFDFEAAHALDGYNGKCRDIHGHSYHLRVTVIGNPIEDTSNIKCGMIIDFSEIKRIVNREIIDIFDHAFVVRSDSRFKGIEENNSRILYVDYQPTCENLVLDFSKRISAALPENVKLLSIFLRETASSYAEWYASDNEI